jgi:hemoglobin-like flavoprotein
MLSRTRPGGPHASEHETAPDQDGGDGPVTPADWIERSFELAAERCEDLTPRVYAHLFQAHPEMQALFGADAGDQVKGEMLAQAIQSILDFIGEHHYAAALIRSEIINHAGFQVPPEVFSTFFATLADSLAELLGPDWSPDMAAAWTDLLRDLGAHATLPAPVIAAASI